jgi:hypothetical protein
MPLTARFLIGPGWGAESGLWRAARQPMSMAASCVAARKPSETLPHRQLRADAALVRASPSEPVSGLPRSIGMRKVGPRLLPLRVQMPFGIVNDEHITLAPTQPAASSMPAGTRSSRRPSASPALSRQLISPRSVPSHSFRPAFLLEFAAMSAVGRVQASC